MKRAPLRRRMILVLAGLLWAADGLGVETRFWEVDAVDEFLTGEMEGISLHGDGEVLLSPDLVPIPLQGEKAPSQPFLWDAVLDRDGNLYLGSGVQGMVYRVDPRGETSIAFDAPESQVHALAVDSRGRLLVGSSPPGRVYRVEENGDALLLLETGERYIWDLEVGRGDALYVATGERGLLFRVDPEGEAGVLFDADEPHLVSLSLDVDGSVLAGSAGTGLVYEIDPEGRARVLLDAEGDEVVAVTLLPSGTAYAAVNTVVLPEEKEEDKRDKPKERLAGELPQGPSPAPRGVEDLAGEEEDEDLLLATPPRERTLQLRSAVYRIAPTGPPQKLWESGSEGVHSMRAAAPERIYFGTGVPGSLYLLDAAEEGPARLLRRFQESQLTAIAVGVGGQLYAVTSNDGRLYRATADFGSSGTYLSSVLDARADARWGQVSWIADAPAGTRVELATRSGSSSRPDATWSEWSPAYARSEGSIIASPPARHLQFRARLTRLGDAETPRLRSVRLSYREANLPPAVSDLKLAPEEAPEGSAPATLRVSWKASDPNGDRLSYDLHRRGEADEGWRPLATGLSEPRYDWDTTELDGGRYRLQLRASDEPDNGAGAALVATATSRSVLVDHRPPDIEVLSAAGDGGIARISLRVRDDLSPVIRADYTVDGSGPRRRLQAKDGLDDGLVERYELALEVEPGARSFRLSATDRAGNRRTITVPVQVGR